jgi:hypothetical protein
VLQNSIKTKYERLTPLISAFLGKSVKFKKKSPKVNLFDEVKKNRMEQTTNQQTNKQTNKYTHIHTHTHTHNFLGYGINESRSLFIY